MKICPALAALEFDDIPSGIFATDAMLKKAPIGFFKSGTITRGRYLALIGGTPASVREAVQEAYRAADGHVVDEVTLPDVDGRLYEALFTGHRSPPSRALAVIETATACASIRGAEAALKGTPVELVEIRVADSGLAGKGVLVLDGDLHDVEAAVGLTMQAVTTTGGLASYRLIPAPHEAVTAQVNDTTRFASARLIDLDGEVL